MMPERPVVSRSFLVLLAALLLTALYNFSYFAQVLDIYPASADNLGFIISIVLLQCCLTVALLHLLSFAILLRPLLILIFISSSLAAYFMDSYHVILDSDMVRNVVQTQPSEAFDLISPRLALYLVFLGLLPSALTLWVRLKPLKPLHLLLGWISHTVLALLASLILVLISYQAYSSFFREHKSVRYHSNPLFWTYSIGKYLARETAGETMQPIAVGLDAAIEEDDADRELIILVVGETARADHFELNGYPRATTPMLQKEQVISFTRFSACGTSTAYSLPCMFSDLDSNEYSTDKAQRRENLLDVLARAGVEVLWRDNNSNSKGVADRVNYQNYRDPRLNPVCDPECRDIGMLSGLQDYIDQQSGGDILIVLHQMGNHGPAYFKRYPQAFEFFTPACASVDLQTCSRDSIINAYDNAIRYTDHFLAQAIDLLKHNDDRFETALLYVSDHGESLGEGGIYLHGLPKFIAPENQLHVPALLWLGRNYHHVNRAALSAKAEQPLSHDHLFHTLLGLFEIQSSVYRREMDIVPKSK